MSNTDFKNILFINFGGIGDEILFLPTIVSMKEKFNSAKITLALEPRSKCIKDLTNLINNTIGVNIKASGIKKYFNILFFIIICWFKRFDCVISSGKSPMIALILFLTGIKTRVGYNSKLDFLLSQKIKLNENQYAAKMYHDLVKPFNDNYCDPNIEITGDFKLGDNFRQNEYIVIHPGVSKMSVSKNILKCPSIDFWLKLIKGLLEKNKQIILLGTQDDKDLIEKILKNEEISNHPNFINYFNKTKNIMEMAFIMKNSANVICVDSAPLHVAVGINCNVFAIFGPTNNKKLIPDRQNVILVHNNIPCRPCLWHRRSDNCDNSICLNIDPDLILKNII